jgi:cytochrome c nitrite reductase small subunit
MTKLPFVIAMLALVIALGTFLAVTDAVAFAGSAPETCNNCHVMDAAYENWFHGGHRHAGVTCNDCHLPHDNIFAYYYQKGKSGMHDVYVFSTGQVPVMIRANEDTIRIVQENCIHCHQDTVDPMLGGVMPLDRQCWDCHRAAAHGQRGISLAPYQDSQIYDK